MMSLKLTIFISVDGPFHWTLYLINFFTFNYSHSLKYILSILLIQQGDGEDGLCVSKDWENHSRGTKDSCFTLFQNVGRVCCSILGTSKPLDIPGSRGLDIPT